MHDYFKAHNAIHLAQMIDRQYKGIDIVMFGDQSCCMSFERTEKGMYIVFRGSLNIRDWVRNLQRDQVPHAWGNVHRGAYRSLQINLMNLLGEVRMNYFTPVFIGGHSAGGAYAQLFATEILLMGVVNPRNIEVYTFGSQLVGDSDFVACLNSRVPDNFTLMHESDPVPGMPLFDTWQTLLTPWSWLSRWNNRYVRAGKPLWFDGQKWQVRKSVGRALKTYLLERNGILLGDFLRDHYFANYLLEVTRAGSFN